METNELLFELSHSVRYEIMKALAAEPLKLTKLGGVVGANNPEVSRHLDRLKKADLVEKDPEGYYILTPFGDMIMSALPYLSLATSNRGFFKEHDLSRLPPQFLCRLGELSSCEVLDGVTANILRMVEGYTNCRERICSVTSERSKASEGDFKDLGHLLASDMEFRVVVEDSLLEDPDLIKVLEFCGPQKDKHFRVLLEIPLFCTLIDNKTMIAFRDRTGKLDFSVCFWSTDPTAVKWSEELIDYLWEKGKKP